MDRQNPGTVEGYSIMRLLAAIFLLAAACGTAGCIATQLKANTDRPVEATMDVFAQASIFEFMMDNACMFPFSTPHVMAAASPMLTRVFESRLEQRRPFAQIRLVPCYVSSDAQAIWYARKEDCSIAIVPALLYMMDGTGDMPTKLVVRIRILDATTGQVLWDIEQRAWSNPGPDIDLTWNTIVGRRAQRCRVLAGCLADRFAAYLAQPIEQETKEQAGSQQ